MPVLNKHWQPDEVADVLIVGGGMAGMSTALELQKRGKRVLVCEARNIGFGTSGGTTAHLNTFLDTTYPQIDRNFGKEDSAKICAAAKSAIALIKENIHSYHFACGFNERSGYLFAKDEKQAEELQQIVESSRAAGCEVNFCDEIPLKAAFTSAARFEEQAQFHPLQYLTGIAEAFVTNGGFVLQQCRVLKVEPEGDLLHVETSKGLLLARQLVYATHTPPGVNLLHFRLAPYRSYALALHTENHFYPEALIYDMDEPYHYYRSQQLDGKRYLIAGGQDHKTGHNENTSDCFDKLKQFVGGIIPIKEVAFSWSSQYFESTDGLPYIGHLPGNPENVFVATGFGGNGMIYSHVSAMLLADMLTGKENPLQKLLDPNRIKPVAGFASFVKESADVAREFISKFFAPEKVKDLDTLAINEARVVKLDGEAIAVYRDDAGKIHAVSPECTHINCHVKWNNAELSWDCPCHGSRFDADGALLTAPARKNLDAVLFEKDAN